MISDANKDRAFLRQDVSCFVSWILLESWCMDTAAGKVTYAQSKIAGYVFSLNWLLESRNFGKNLGAVLDEQTNVNSVWNWAVRADAIFGQVSKGISRALEGMTSLLDMGFLRDLLNSVSMLMLKHLERMQKNGKGVQKQLKKMIHSLSNSASWCELKSSFRSFPAYPRRLRSNLIETLR